MQKGPNDGPCLSGPLPLYSHKLNTHKKNWTGTAGGGEGGSAPLIPPLLFIGMPHGWPWPRGCSLEGHTGKMFIGCRFGWCDSVLADIYWKITTIALSCGYEWENRMIDFDNLDQIIFHRFIIWSCLFQIFLNEKFLYQANKSHCLLQWSESIYFDFPRS